jgi:hypothetical protein
VKPGTEYYAQHEGFHQALSHIRQRYGIDEYNKIKEVMLSQIHPDDRAMIHLKAMSWNYNPNDPSFEEEILAHTHSHLSGGAGKSPEERKQAKQKLMDSLLGPGGWVKRQIAKYRGMSGQYYQNKQRLDGGGGRNIASKTSLKKLALGATPQQIADFEKQLETLSEIPPRD